MINWLSLGRGLDLHPSQGARGPPAQSDRAEAQPVFLAQLRHFPAGRGGHRHGHLVEAEITHEAEGTPRRRRSFGGFGRAIWWSNKKQAAKPGNRPPTPPTKLLTIPDDQFQEIRIKKLTSEVQDLKRENGKWRMVEPKPLPADQDAVGVHGLHPRQLTADKSHRRQRHGSRAVRLRHPHARCHRSSGKMARPTEVLVGDDTPRTPALTPSWPTTAKVFTIASYVKTSLDKRHNELRDKRLLTFDSDKLTRVELAAKGPAVEFGKNGQNEWQIVKPRPLRADGSAGRWPGQQTERRQDGSHRSGRRQEIRRRVRQGGHRHRHRRRGRPDPRSPSATKTRTTSPRAPPSKACTRSTSDLGDALDKGAGRFPQQEALRFRLQRSQPDRPSRARSTPRAATSGCPAPRRWTTPPCRT